MQLEEAQVDGDWSVIDFDSDLLVQPEIKNLLLKNDESTNNDDLKVKKKTSFSDIPENSIISAMTYLRASDLCSLLETNKYIFNFKRISCSIHIQMIEVRFLLIYILYTMILMYSFLILKYKFSPLIFRILI